MARKAKAVVDRGVPLSHYLAHRRCQVLLICRVCVQQTTYPIPDVIRHLTLRGVGGGETGIKELARHVKTRCPRCGSMKWETRPWFDTAPEMSIPRHR